MRASWDMGPKRGWALVLVATMPLAACGIPEGRPGRATVAAPRPAEPAPATRQCLANLAAIDVRFTPLPDQRYGGGCTAIGSVRLLDIGVPATNLGAMTCPLAANFVAWARFGVEPAARLLLGGEIARIETFGTYNCRPIAGSAKLSEHAHSNAVDVSAFVLTDGRRITVKDGWSGDRRARQFLTVVHASACKRFRTVLGPDYNAAHQDHLHFDMGGNGGFCR